MSRSRRTLFGLTLLLAWGLSLALAPAMSVVPTDFDRLIDRAELIFRGRVESVTPAWEGAGPDRHIVTRVTLRVDESYFGGTKGTQTLRFFGGRLDGRVQRIVGMPEFQVGDEELLFVRGNGVDLCPLVGLHHGRFRVAKSAAAGGPKPLLLHDGTPLTDVRLIGKSAERLRPAPGAAAATALSVEAFGELVRAALRARQKEPDPR